MILAEANEKQLEQWDAFIDNSINGTIFHKRRFLDYHGSKFSDKEKFLVILNGSTVFAQISLILEESEGKRIVKSPYGGSYGGFVFASLPTYKIGDEITKIFLNYLKELNVVDCILTHPISCCCKMPLDTFYFNLLENGFQSRNRDISTVKFIEPYPMEKQVSASVRSQIKLTMKKGIKINEHPDLAGAYDVLYKEKKEKFGNLPTHSFNEFLRLHELFPKEIQTVTAEYEGEIISGATCFHVNEWVNAFFYIFMDNEFKELNPVRPLILHELVKSQNMGDQFFDFGTSSVNMEAHKTIFAFKEGFTKVGMFRESFGWKNGH